jgi:hypothetical protein
MDLARAVPALLGGHPLIDSVRLAGSRSTCTAHELSDWDFAVETSDLSSLKEDLPALVEPLDPLVGQWDPYANHAAYMLILRGPTKIDLAFFDEPRAWAPPWDVSRETLIAVDHHFWDWILWLEQKRRGAKDDQVATSLLHMYERMLEPMGARVRPESVVDALSVYLGLRARLEESYGVHVPRDLEREVRPVLLAN